MALQGSGAIKISQIKAEKGETSNSLATLSTNNINQNSASRPDGNTPHSMSEFYSYDHTYAPAPQFSTAYWQMFGANDRLVWRTQSPTFEGYTQQISFSFWYKPNRPSKDNLLLFDMYPQGTSSNANRMFLNYSASLNRLIARYRSKSSNFDKQYPLHDQNGGVTGVEDPGTGWCLAQPGAANSAGFVHIVLTYDGTQGNSTQAFQLYWNGQLLTDFAAANNGARYNFEYSEITWGNDYNSGTGDAAGFDEMRMYSRVLSQQDINTIYNGGQPADINVDGIVNSIAFEDTAEVATPVESTGQWSRHIATGSLTDY